MYRIVEGSTYGLADVVKFVDLINTPPESLHDLFDQEMDVFVARAPGRLDVMGGIADYSGSLVLEMPIAEATFAALQKREDRRIKIVSRAQDSLRDLVFEMLLPATGEITDYEVLRDSFVEKGSDHWASYVAGVFLVLMKELGVEFRSGANILISSGIPIGKGVSSSAALEVATMQATCAAFDIDLEAQRFAELCQLVENRVVGAPCGIMDQLTSHCGTANSLLPILCQPAEIGEGIQIPDELDLWGIDSGVRHAVAGSDYTSVRVGAFMGYRIIADAAGLEARSEKGELQIDDPHWRGYLSNVSETEYKQRFPSTIPKSIVGWEFLDKYGGITDKVTKIDPERSYPVRAATEHAIYENAR
jgi:L-arabinokinase